MNRFKALSSDGFPLPHITRTDAHAQMLECLHEYTRHKTIQRISVDTPCTSHIFMISLCCSWVYFSTFYRQKGKFVDFLEAFKIRAFLQSVSQIIWNLALLVRFGQQ